MLSLAQLQNAKIDPEVAREAYEQAEKRLGDILEAKKGFEQKAAVLFSGFTTLALGLIGVGAALLKDSLAAKVGGIYVTGAFIAAGLTLVLAAWWMVRAMEPKKYGALGSTPDMWLNTGTIDRPDTVPLMLAYITHHLQQRIDASVESNDVSTSHIERGIKTALAAPIVLTVGWGLALRFSA